MKKSWIVCGLFLATAAPAQMVMQQPVSYCSDPLAVTGFALNPAQPSLNQTVTATMNIRNGCSSSRTVPWRLLRNDAVAASGSVSISGNQTVAVSTTWVATEGVHQWSGDVDPAATIVDFNHSNNAASPVNITVPGPCGATADVISVSYRVYRKPTSTSQGYYLANPAKFTVGNVYVFEATVRNLCHLAAVTVPWNMKWSNGTSAGEGTVTVAADGYATVTSQPWTATVGTFNVAVNVNSPATALVPEQTLTNNSASLELSPRIARGTLIADSSLRSAASLSTDTSGRNCNLSAPQNIQDGRNSAFEVRFDCGSSTIFGGKAYVDAFNGQSLQNGWKIVSSSVSWTYGGSIAFDLQPANQGTDLHSKFHVAADSGVLSVGDLYITVEGPDGASPHPQMFVIVTSYP